MRRRRVKDLNLPAARVVEIKALLAEALRRAERARRLRSPADEVEESALRWELYASLQNVLDAVAMIVADLGLRKPGSYSELGDPLLEARVVDPAERDLIAKIARVKNSLAHAYRRLSQSDLGKIIDELMPAVEQLVRKLLAVCDERGLDPPEGSSELKEVFKRHGVALAYLFGSRARGRARGDSDYDIAILFERQSPGILDEVELAMDIARELGVPPEGVDVVSLNNADVLLKARVLKEGILIYAKDDEFRRMWERRTYVELLDELELLALYLHRLLKKINAP